MANKTGKYNSFKQWLMWCRGKNNASATKLASYLRRLEADLLMKLPEPEKCKPFHELHQMLLDIDKRKAVNFSLEDVVLEFKKILSAIDKERKEEDIKNQVSEVEPEVLDDWRGAFNAYLKYLSDITRCFTMDIAMHINPKIEIGGQKSSSCYSEQSYKIRLKLFKKGVYKCIVDKLGFNNVVDNVLDAFSESVDLLTQSSPYEIPTQFIVNSPAKEIGSWRTILLDKIQSEENALESECGSFRIMRTTTPDKMAKSLSDILYKICLLNNKLSTYVMKETDPNEAISVKEVIKRITTTDIERFLPHEIDCIAESILTQIRDYVSYFKLQFEYKACL